jgi:hypothetical protein
VVPAQRYNLEAIRDIAHRGLMYLVVKLLLENSKARPNPPGFSFVCKASSKEKPARTAGLELKHLGLKVSPL